MKTINSDIIIIGGGSAGIAAAVAAARKGLKVLIIERNAYLGGKATAAEVGTICGLYAFSRTEKSSFIVNGFAREFGLKIQELSKTEPISNRTGLHFLPYSIEKYKEYSLKLLNDNCVDVLFNAELKEIKIEGNKISNVIVHRQEESILLKFNAVIDCSGESTVSRLGNLPLIPQVFRQAAAQVFTIQGIKDISEDALSLVLIREMTKAIHANKLENNFDRLYIVPGSLKNGKVSLKLGLPLEMTVLEETSDKLAHAIKVMIDKLVQYLIDNCELFSSASLEHVADEIGTRIGFRPKGKYILNENDVLYCKKFDSAIANCSWPIEKWGQNRAVEMHYFEENDFYQIPSECLISDSITNLFFGGRNISADDSAIASARVMGICMQTGYAAGFLAAGLILGLSENSTVKEIQKEQIFL